MRKILLASVLSLLICSLAYALDFTGTYTLSENNVTLTLALKQNSKGGVQGTLTSTAGAKFELAGKVDGDVAYGICKSEEGGLFFHVRLQD